MTGYLMHQKKQTILHPLFLLCRQVGRQVAYGIAMKSAYERLIRIAESGSPEIRPADIEEFSDYLLRVFLDYSWFPQTDTDWGYRVAREAAELVLSKLLEMRKRGVALSTIQKIVSDFVSSPATAAFLTPEAIRLIYSDPPSEWSDFVSQGAEHHCRLIRHAASMAIRKHTAGMKRVSLDTRELEDELFGVVMEEVLRCLSDPSARVWTRNQAIPAVFPLEGTRGMRHGMIVRIALSKEGKRLATYRSDRQLFVWNLENKELIRSWDLSLFIDSPPDETITSPPSLFFSVTGSNLALETRDKIVFVFTVDEEEHAIRSYDENTQKEFLSEFGIPFLADRNAASVDGFSLRTRIGDETNLIQYTQKVYDWCCDRPNRIFAAASETERAMPEWMRRAGFDRAVFHIAKKRLIDLIRKRTHTNYACWRCGSMISGLSDTQCRRCGADFTRCPLGCETSEPLGVSNRWQCPCCGMASRNAEAMIPVEVEDWYAAPPSPESEWRDSHDIQRILDVLKNTSVAYKKKDIPCDRVILLKAEGKTNEEIGTELGIPRGSVDYIWNQCRQQIILSFGE